jgi:hypothetical protein
MKENWDSVYSHLSKNRTVLNWSIEMGLSHFSDFDTERDITSFFADKDVERFRRSLVVATECIRRNALFKQRSEADLANWFGDHGFDE